MKKLIAIVDDKVMIAKVIFTSLKEDYDFVYFDNPLKIIEWLKEGNRPDLILSDIRMPKMTGDELLMHLKKDPYYKEIPIIILSAEDSSSMRIKLLENGAEDYVVKPFNPNELKIRIKKILG